MLAAGVAAHGRNLPTMPTTDWWIKMSARIDVTSARFHGGFGMISLLKKLPSCTQSESWRSLLDTSIDLVKVNASAGLSSVLR